MPIRVLVLGDSLSAGYGLSHADGFEAQLQATLKDEGQGIQIVDGAVSGDTTAGGLARLDWSLGAGGADAAIVELGANDGLRGVDPARTEANLAAILDRLHARGIPVLLAGMKALPNMGPDYAALFTATYDHLAARSDVVFEPFFLEGVALHPDLQLPDRLHPNAPGVRVIVAHILPQVRTLLSRVHQADGAKTAR